MKIYTKTGDKGTTSLYGGTKVSKHHLRIEAYGTVDELNSQLGMVRCDALSNSTQEVLIQVQKNLFVLGAELATPTEKLTLENGKPRLPVQIQPADIQQLEQQIDEMEKELPTLTRFILPGGFAPAAHCHIARTVCRRAERIVVALNDLDSVRSELIIYLNRLSDFLFVLARFVAHRNGQTEYKWIPGE